MNENEKIIRRNPDIELLGQKLSYPRRWQGVFVVLILSAAFIVISYIVLVESRPENLKTLGLFTGNIQIGTDSIVKRNKFCFGFWTPSVSTKAGMAPYLQRFPNKKEKYAWQIHNEKENNISEKNKLFGELILERRNISGFRRHPAVGKSSSALKEGWWWVIGVEGAYSAEFFTWFADLYKSHWGLKKNETIYVEVSAIDLKK